VNKAPMADLCSAGILLAVLGVHPALGEPAGRPPDGGATPIQRLPQSVIYTASQPAIPPLTSTSRRV